MSATAVAAPAAPATAPAKKTGGQRVAPKPDFDKHAAHLKDLNDQIDQIKAQQTKLRERISQLQVDTAQSGSNDKRGELKEKLTTAQRAQNDARRQREDSMRRILTLQDSVRVKQAEIKHIKDRLGFQSVADVDARISQLEERVNAGTLKLLEEKKAINEIAQLKRSKPLYATLAAKEAEIAKESAELATLQSKLESSSSSRAATATTYDAVKKELDAIAGAKKAAYDQLQAAYDEQKQLSDKLNTLYDSRTLMQDSFREAKEAHFRTLREDRARKQEAYAEQKKRIELEKLAELAQEERDLADFPAFSDEIVICTNLISYVKQAAGIKGSIVPGDAAPASSAAKKPTSGALAAKHQVRKVETPANAELFKKKDDAMDILFAGASSKKKGKKSGRTASAAAPAPAKRSSSPAPAAAAADDEAPAAAASTHSAIATPLAVFKFALTIMENFWLVKVDVPVTHADAPATIAALVARREWYMTHSAAVTARNKAAAEAKIAKLAAGLEKLGSLDGVMAEQNGVAPSAEETAAAAPADGEEVEEEEVDAMQVEA
ncbi:hypothetical protein BC828DRAFT_377570 [Blastocladiella britannica]|nr:hypothetical protein BC828DRAFT_377570 [Blastocladiella britannica]